MRSRTPTMDPMTIPAMAPGSRPMPSSCAVVTTWRRSRGADLDGMGDMALAGKGL